jgi:hypothetical protein
LQSFKGWGKECVIAICRTSQNFNFRHGRIGESFFIIVKILQKVNGVGGEIAKLMK